MDKDGEKLFNLWVKKCSVSSQSVQAVALEPQSAASAAGIACTPGM